MISKTRLVIDLRDLICEMNLNATIGGKAYNARGGLAKALSLIAENLASGLEFDAQAAAEEIIDAAGLSWWFNEG